MSKDWLNDKVGGNLLGAKTLIGRISHKLVTHCKHARTNASIMPQASSAEAQSDKLCVRLQQP